MYIDVKNIFKVLRNYKLLIEAKLEEDLQREFGPKNKLKEACAYALLNDGKRFRPSIVMMVAKALNYEGDISDAAVAVEYFHTASLIADDLPCMDDDDFRRNKPSLHKAFNESVALLASYALIAQGYKSILNSYQKATLPSNILTTALELATKNTGILGATGGQFLDLFPPDSSKGALLDILNKKTVTLFEIAFGFGWIFGGGDINRLEDIKKLAYHFGMAFQIADDLDDLQQDKKQQELVNLALVIGVDKAKDIFLKEKEEALLLAKDLAIDSPEFLAMLSSLSCC
jgi:geranylgeranyl diphosphate synthase type II